MRLISMVVPTLNLPGMPGDTAPLTRLLVTQKESS